MDFISKDVRKHMADNKFSFTDFEKAGLISEADCLTVNEKHMRLEAIAAKTNDETLKAQITEQLSADRNDIAALKAPTEGYVYSLITHQDGKQPTCRGYFGIVAYAYARGEKQGDFKIFDRAYDTGKKSGCKFKIIKRLAAECENDDCIGYIKYDENGDITDFSYKDSRYIYEPDRFCERFAVVPNPFEKGDIVRYLGDGAHGIVFTSQEEWNDILNEYKKDLEDDKLCPYIGIETEFFNSDGSSAYSIVSPAFIEKYEPKKDDEDYDLLMTASAFCKKEFTLDSFTECCDNYKKKHNKKE